jgi:tRNA nucleotidyltransferase (CCA-adding enzyme)
VEVMPSPIEEIIAEVLKRVTPNRSDRKHVLSLARGLKRKVKEAAKEKGVEAGIRVEGSVAKDTWLREEPEL